MCPLSNDGLGFDEADVLVEILPLQYHKKFPRSSSFPSSCVSIKPTFPPTPGDLLVEITSYLPVGLEGTKRVFLQKGTGLQSRQRELMVILPDE